MGSLKHRKTFFFTPQKRHTSLSKFSQGHETNSSYCTKQKLVNEYLLYFWNLSMLKLQLGPILFQIITPTKTGIRDLRAQPRLKKKSDPSHTALQAVWALEPQKFTLNESTGTFKVLRGKVFLHNWVFFPVYQGFTYSECHSVNYRVSCWDFNFLLHGTDQGLHLQNLNTSGL